MNEGPGDYDRGHLAGEVAARLARHDDHFNRINGSLERVADELHQLRLGQNATTLAIQRLDDNARADAVKVIATAEALEKADAARRDKSEQSWTPMQRAMAVIATLATVVGIYLAFRGR